MHQWFDSCREYCHPFSSTSKVVYGNFARNFTFSGGVQLPIVQPGGSLIFPSQLVPPRNVRYVENASQVGLLVPQGVYLVRFDLHPAVGASVSLLVNGIAPTYVGTSFPYTVQNQDSELDMSLEVFVVAPLLKENLISLVNSGTALFTLGNLANSTQGDTSVLTRILVKRISDI